MNAPNLDDIAKQLEKGQEKAAARAAQLRQELSAAEEEVARLDGAIAALRGKPSPVTNAKASSKSPEKRKASAPAASRVQVVELMTTTLRTKGVMKPEQLKIAVENQLVAAGLSRSGYALRFNEASTDARFVFGQDGVTLQRAAAAAVTATPAASDAVAELSSQTGDPGHPNKTLHT